MKKFYFSTTPIPLHKPLRIFRNGKVIGQSVIKTSQINLKALFLSAFLCIFLSIPFRQIAQTTVDTKNYNGFNELYWKSMAMKKQLNANETKEFLDFQKLRYLNPDSFVYHASDPKLPVKVRVIGGGAGTQTVATGCNNIDFEAGSTSGWTLSSGFHPNSSSTPTCCPTSGAQNSVTSGTGLDPFGGFPIVFPGGSNSLRLGNSATGAQADRIVQKIFVTTANANFTYRYAVVLQDPGHNISEQPAFTIEMIDTLGNQIPCTYYNVAAGSNIPGFFASTVQAGVIYKPWTSVVVDLTPNIGQNVFIRFTTYDCSLGGHFGYAYIDGFCTNFATSVSDTTCPGVPINVCGPIGFGFYSWTGPGIVSTNSNQCIGITTPGVYTCQTILVPGCPGPTFTHTLNTLYAPVLSFTPTTTGPCAFNYSFTGSVSIPSGSIINYSWDFGNGLTSNLLNPTTTYTAAGTYPVKFKATSDRSCSDSVITNITIYPYPIISFSPPNSCLNSVVNFSSTSTIAVGSVNSFTWNFANGTTSNATNPTNTYTQVGAYNVTLTASSDKGCTSTAVSALTIHPLPSVTFSATNVCFGNTTALNPTVTIAAGSIASFSWNLGNGSTSTNYSASANYSAPGNYVVSYSATSNFNCLTTNTQTVSIYPLPVVNFSVNGVCLNVASSFTPNMSIPLGSISSFSWNYGDGGTAGAINNPSHTYTNVNTFTPTLTAVSNMGCINTNTAAAIIYPLPVTAFIATTQCVNSPLSFTNTSSISSGSISSQLWNFGAAQTSTLLNPVFTFTNSGINTVTLTTVSDFSCSTSATANMIIQQQPSVSAMLSQTLCSNINTIALSGTVSGVTNTGAWLSSGTGVFSNSVALNTTYTITNADITSGSVTFSLSSTNNSACASANNTMALIITPLATVNAGPNLNVCSSQNTLALVGSINSPSTTGIWSTSGSGTFAPTNTNVNTSYAFTSAEINAGLVIYTLTSSNNGTCPAVADTVMMRISKQPTVTVIPTYTICSSAANIVIGGSVTGVTNTGAWFSSGTGVLSSSTNLSPTYTLSNADRTLTALQFTLNSTNNGVCPPASQILSLAIAPLATVNAGPNFTICSTQSLNLNANIIGSTNTGSWSTTGNGTFTSVSSLTTGYIPGTTDLLFGVVDLYLTSTNNGFCPPVRDTVHVLINKQATLSTLPTLTICSSFTTVALSGSIAGTSSTGLWASNGSGSFNNANNFNTTYSLSTADRTLSTILFTLSSTNNGPCATAANMVTVSVIPISTVNAGPNQALCSAAQSVALSGSISSLPSGFWSGNSGGNFVNGNNLSSIYYFSPGDMQAGIVTLTLTANNNSVCPTVADTVQIRIIRQPTVNAGPDLTVCSNNNTVTVRGQIIGATNTGTWSSGGGGGFVPTNTPITTYSLVSSDYSLTSIVFILYSTNNSICNMASDTMVLRVYKQPIVQLHGDTLLCDKYNPFNLSGTVLNGSGAVQWLTTGSGTFSPNAFANPTKYYVSAGDKQDKNILFSLYSMNTNACGNVASSFYLKLLPTPKVKFSVSTNNLTLPSNTVALFNESEGATTYTWTFGNGSVSNSTNATTAYNDVGIYHVILVGENESKCSDTADTFITVVSDVLWPNAFTPNPSGSNGGRHESGDYSNDVFFPVVKGVAEFDMMIFNRWGQMLFESKDIKVGWDGYFNGKLCQQDIYVWKANIVFLDGRSYTKTGNITLLR